MNASVPATEDHILLLPFLARGHLRPTLHLAHLLQTHTPFTITLLTTPLNAASTHRLADDLNYHVNIVDLPFHPTDHGLPPNVENTEKLPLNSIISLFCATLSLEPHLRDYLTRHHSQRPPLCIIFDIFLGWANTVAKSIGSTGICFNTGGAYGNAAYMAIWTHLPHRNVSDDEEFSLPWFPEDRKFQRNQLHRFLRSDDWSRFFQPQIKLSMSCSGWLSNTVEEVENLGFEILRNQLNSPQWGVGSLIMDPEFKPELLPQGFEERMRERKQGKLVHKWGPQSEILNHEATGAF